MPITHRKAISEAGPKAKEAPSVPRMKTPDAARISRRRPQESLSRPERPAPSMAPTRRPETTRPSRSGVRAMSFLMKSMAPEMTPVS